MRALFADTFYWVALTSTEDTAHGNTVEVSRSLKPERIVTDEVLTEYLAFFSNARPSVRTQAGSNAVDLIHNPIVRVIAQSRESFLSGLELYCARPDKGYSLTDCISMRTMRREGITEVLTNDRHFEQEGFRALLRDC